MLTRSEAEEACRGVRNLWPRDESEALRYRRQVVPAPKKKSIDYCARRLLFLPWWIRRWVGSTWSVDTIQDRRSGATSVTYSVPDLPEFHCLVTMVSGYALVEWLAPDGRCADHGDVERHGEQEAQFSGRAWYRGQLFPDGVMLFSGSGCRECDRFTDEDGRERLTAEHPDHARRRRHPAGRGRAGDGRGGVLTH